MLALKKAGTDLVIIPRNPTKEVFHNDALSLLPNAIWSQLISVKMVWTFLVSLIMEPPLWKYYILFYAILDLSKFCAKVWLSFLKRFFVHCCWKKCGIGHIHAHWGSTTATMGYVISHLSGIPWSFTLHRWDIYEIICSRRKSGQQVLQGVYHKRKGWSSKIIGSKYADKVQIVHMGVEIPIMDKALIVSRFNNWDALYKKFVFILPANLLPVKGHEYLIRCSFSPVTKWIKKLSFYLLWWRAFKEKAREIYPQQKAREIYRNARCNTSQWTHWHI